MIRTILWSILSLASALTLVHPNFAQAKEEKRIPIRATDKLTPDQWKVIRQAQLQRYIEYFNSQVKNGKDFDRAFLSNVKAKYREEVRPLLAELGEAPVLKRDGDTLVVNFKDSTKVRIRYPERGSDRAEIEGVSWIFDPTASIKWQIDSFVTRMRPDGGASALFNFIVPEAEAVAKIAIAACKGTNACKWIAVTAGGAIVGSTFGNLGVGDGLYKSWCYVNSKVWRPWESVGWCEEWKMKQDARAKLAAAEAAARQERDPNQDWVPKNPDCPDDGKTFDALMKEVQGNTEKGTWFRFHAVTVNDKITSAFVFDDPHADVSKPEANASIKLIYNKEIPPRLESMQFRNKDYNKSDPSDTEFITFYLNDDPTKIDPKYRDRVPKQAAFAESAQKWVDTCRNMAKAARFNDENPGAETVITPASVKDSTPAKATN